MQRARLHDRPPHICAGTHGLGSDPHIVIPREHIPSCGACKCVFWPGAHTLCSLLLPLSLQRCIKYTVIILASLGIVACAVVFGIYWPKIQREIQRIQNS
jgi:hypothetical protein